MGKTKKLLIGLSIGLLVLLIAILAGVSWELRPQPSDSALPILARGLSAGLEKGNAEFRNRVLSRFKPGLTVAQVRKELLTEGFQDTKDGAFFEQSRFPCLRRWGISWKHQQERITAINAFYGAYCL